MRRNFGRQEKPERERGGTICDGYTRSLPAACDPAGREVGGRRRGAVTQNKGFLQGLGERALVAVCVGDVGGGDMTRRQRWTAKKVNYLLRLDLCSHLNDCTTPSMTRKVIQSVDSLRSCSSRFLCVLLIKRLPPSIQFAHK